MPEARDCHDRTGLEWKSTAPGLGAIASGVMHGWQGVTASGFVTGQAIRQNEALGKIEMESMQKQALITLVTNMIEGASKTIKGAGEAIKGLC